MNGAFPRDRLSAFESLHPVRERRGWFIALGVALMLLGFLAVAVPFVASLATTLFVGWMLIVGGVAHGIHAAQNRAWKSFPWEVLNAVLHVAAGALILAFPVAGTLTLTLALAGFFTAEGVIKVVVAVQHRGMERWGFLLFDGAVTLGLGLLILTRWPAAAIWVIGLLVGVHLLVSGMSMLWLAAAAARITRLPA